MKYFISNNPTTVDLNTDNIIKVDFNYLDRWCQDKKVLGVDTETEGRFDHVNKILSLQIGDEHDQFFIDFNTLNSRELNSIKAIMYDQSVTKIFHNAKFDIKFLWRHGIPIRNTHCTQVNEVLLHAGIKQEKGYYALDGIVNRRFGAKLDKTVRGRINKTSITDTKVIQYGCDDVKFLIPIMREQLVTAQEYFLSNGDSQDEYTVVGLENKVLHAYAEMEYIGMKIFPERWREVGATIDQDYKDSIDRLNTYILENETWSKMYVRNHNTLFGPETNINFNWASPKQKLELLRVIFPTIKDTDSKRTLVKYKKKHPIVKELIEYNRLNKLVTSYVNPMLSNVNSRTGRIHTSFWQVLETGRVSSKGPNMQQMPSRTDEGKAMRSCFIEDHGYSLVGGDYSGCELRIIADQSQDPLWLDVFRKGGDLHSILCASTFGINISEVKQKSTFNPTLTWRDIQKTINFGLAYGMSEYKLADVMECDVKLAKGIIDSFFNKVPMVYNYLTGLKEKAITQGFSQTAAPYNRVRFYNNYKNPSFKNSIGRQGMNTPIQGGNADIIKLATLRVFEEKPVEMGIIMQVHDEIITRCPDHLANDWKYEMQHIMERVGNELVKTVPMVAECKITKHWTK